jgi:hypothetical protein
MYNGDVMASPIRYIPILTGKAGEFQALAESDPSVLDRVTPLIDMPPLPGVKAAPKQGDRNPKTPEQVLDLLAARIAQPWTRGRAIAVDLMAYDGLSLGASGPLEYLLMRMEWGGGAQVCVAVRTDASDRYREEAAAAVAKTGLASIRARITPQSNVPTTMARVEEVRSGLGIDPGATQLIFDLGRLDEFPAEAGDSVAGAFAQVDAHLRALPDRDAWAELVLVSTDVPQNEQIRRDNPYRVRRRERQLWQRVAKEAARTPWFGDYGITGPRRDEAITSAPAPHIRYTTASALLIWKGYRPQDVEDPDDIDGPVSFHDLCVQLVDHEEFEPETSPGDRAYRRVAAGEESAESATKWVEFATSHHLAHVVRAV